MYPLFSANITLNLQNSALLTCLLPNLSAILQLISSMASHSHRFLSIFIILAAFCLSRFSCCGGMEKEKTFAMIKPDGVYGNYSDKIKAIIMDSGFSIKRELRVQLDEDTVRSFYAEHSSKSFFPSLVKYMTSGPILVMILEKDNAVADWRKLIGPTDAEKAKVTHPQSIRAMCGLNTEKNCVHGSHSIQSASREMSFFFDAQDIRHDEL
ncbi:probable nucleoside diphosphate kinase 5 isoform X2 [Chenopodium quinoa]|uniref:probable nucleoside diphosphate kinase 5 isoform X2 n=1 Tax=Chenopodium quinoa TaxID=63459 RepID=UPI000B7953BF|nr:probable nucleoside diphosphate kinase 5 isoform X2 [Chenopodium quinoa]